jgi:hypothetical protein
VAVVVAALAFLGDGAMRCEEHKDVTFIGYMGGVGCESSFAAERNATQTPKREEVVKMLPKYSCDILLIVVDFVGTRRVRIQSVSFLHALFPEDSQHWFHNVLLE